MATDPICGMKVDEKHGLKLTHEGKTYYFCSQHCMEKFIEENQITGVQCTECGPEAKQPFYRNKLFIVVSALAVLSLLSFWIPFLQAFRRELFDYFRMIWWAILLGLVLGGVIDYFIPREYVSHVLARPSKRTIVYSVFVGFLMSACSHGILALAIQLYKKGASVPAVVAFLLASPWANMTLTIMLIGLFGLKALFIILSAIVVAIITGLIFQVLEKAKRVETNPHSIPFDEKFSIVQDIKKRVRQTKLTSSTVGEAFKGIFQGIVSLSNMVLWWILIGMGLASLAGAYVPSSFFVNYMGPTIAGLLITLAFATIIEICSEGSAPMAFEIFKQTAAFGNSFVFLMAGVVTDYTEIGLLWHNVGKKTAIMLPVITVPQVILLGMLANWLF
ncbi:MAG: permease [bacterium]